MEKAYKIRRFQKDDLEKVDGFFDHLTGEGKAFFNRNDSTRIGAHTFFSGEDANFVRWMMLDGDKMVGYLFLWDTDKSVVWLGVALADEYKGQGLGAQLLACAKEWAKANGKGGIMLTTHIANLRGQALYERVGYERLGIHKDGEIMYLLRW